MDDNHVFEQVTQYTDMMLVDDCNKYLDLGLFYDNITSDMTVNPKNNHMFTIPLRRVAEDRVHDKLCSYELRPVKSGTCALHGVLRLVPRKDG